MKVSINKTQLLLNYCKRTELNMLSDSESDSAYTDSSSESFESDRDFVNHGEYYGHPIFDVDC